MKRAPFPYLHDIIKEHQNKRPKWKHKDAAEYAEKMVKKYGKPDETGPGKMKWVGKDGFERTYIKDESIPHNHPEAHKDYVYSTRKMTIPEHLVGPFAKATESILIDRLKGLVTTRCGSLWANALTHAYIEKVVSGKMVANRKSYDEYMLKGFKDADMLPKWYKNMMGEKPST